MTDRSHPRVYMSPDYTDSNPYQTALISGIAAADVDVRAVPADGISPLFSAWRQHGRPDVVHLHWIHRFIETDRRGVPILAALLAVRTAVEIALLRVLGITIVWTVHNVSSHEGRTPRIERTLRQTVSRLADVIIVHCTAARELIGSAYGLPDRVLDRVVVIPHGNYDEEYPEPTSRSDARRELGLPDEAPVLLFFGMIRDYKRVPHLIERFRSVADDDAHLIVAGNPWSAELQATVGDAAGGDDRVRTVLEYVPEEAVPRYLAAADALVLPYDGILTSGSAILGMTFERAVIAPKRGCLPALLGDRGGITFDPDDPTGLDGAIERALADREALHRAGAHNRSVADELEWDGIGERTARVYMRAGTDTV